MEKQKLKRHSAGFTLTEVMVTIGILAVLLVLAFPVADIFSNNLRMNKLDAGARNIFVTAQNQMVALRASNNSSVLSSAKPLTAEPSDFSGDNWSSLSYLSSTDKEQEDAFNALLPDNALDPGLKGRYEGGRYVGGCYTIEFNPTTNRIYAVFYSESTFTYNPASMPRDRASRENSDPKIGYYGGGALEAAGNATALSAPELTLTNNDELNVSFKTENVFAGRVSDADFLDKLTYTVMVSSTSDPSKNVTFQNAQVTRDTEKGLYYRKLTTPLDSLTGAHFKTTCASDIAPGEDIKITVIVSYSDDKMVTLPASASVITNSLFALRSNNEALIATARHLQNLQPSVSGVSGVTSAVQSASIDWTVAAGASQTFVPISNPALTSFNGNGLSITGLNIAVSSGDAGLFGNFQGSSLSNIKIVNPKISGGAYSGALAGRLMDTPTTVTNCGVYIADTSNAYKYTVSGTTHAGGLIGYTNAPISITDSFATPYSVYGASTSLGGLIGYCVAGDSSYSISRCYADTDLSSGSSASIGGLIGRNGGTAVKDCYSLGNIKAVSSSYIGGLVGYSANVSYSNCYAVPTFNGNSGGTPYGFSGRNITVSNCACLMGQGYTKGTPNGSVTPSTFAELASWSGGSSWAYAAPSTSHPYNSGLSGKPYPFKHLYSSHHYNDWPSNASPSFAYYEIYSDGSYGYYSLDNAGNELLNTLSNFKGAVVGDGYAVITPNTLSSLSYTYQNSSSGTATANLSSPVSTTINSQTYNRYTLQANTLNGNFADSGFYQSVKINGTTYWYNPHFAKAAINGAASKPAFDGTAYVRSSRQFANLSNLDHKVYWASSFSFLQEIDINFNTYPAYLKTSIGSNPYTYYSDWSSGITGYGGTPFYGSYDGGGNTLTINSTYVSSNLLNSVFGYNSGTIKNLIVATSGNISMGIWDDDPASVLVGVNTNLVQGCTVTLGGNLDMTTNKHCGIIAYSNSGTISDSLVTTSASVTVKSVNGNAALGGIVYSNSGTISNSFIRPGPSSYSALKLQAATAAGFAVNNTGTITGCSATAYITEIWSNSSSCSAAGFVYTNGDNGQISGSYANCVVQAYYASGFAYYANGSGSMIQNCFSMVNVTANTWNGYGWGFVNNPGNGNVKNCYVSAQVAGAYTYTFSGSSGYLGENCRYFQWTNDGITATGTGSSLSAIKSAYSGGVWGSAVTHVYREQFINLPDNCPFPMLANMDFYGDWCDPYNYMFAYYEKYSDNSYGYYVMQSDKTVLIDTLSQSKGAIIDDGYMLLTREAVSNLTITSDSGGGTANGSLGTDTINISGTNLKYYRYFVPSYILNNDTCSSNFYMNIRIDNFVYYYNPHFAKAAITDATSLPSFDGNAYIRSSRQLTNLGNSNHSTYWSSNYKIFQELDVNYSTYSYSFYIDSAIGTGSSSPFRGIYDGQGNTITINGDAKSNRNALFGYITGTVKNLKVATSDGFTMGKGDSALFAAVNTGTIDNCSVILGADLGFAGSSFGVFVNTNTSSGTISDCLVTSSAPVTVSTTSSINLGGFVFTNSGTISNSYVRPGGGTYSSLTLKGSNTAGFVYNSSGGSVSYCSVTAAVTVVFPMYSGNNAAGFVYSPGDGTITRCYSNCVVTAYNAAGFAYDCSGLCKISYCYAMLKISANTSGGTAAGFTITGNKEVDKCYAATQVSGKTAYYFSAENVGSQCRYLDWTGNGNTEGGNTPSAPLKQLKNNFSTSPWGAADSYSYWDLFQVTPPSNFPLIAGLTHYGDWPLV